VPTHDLSRFRDAQDPVFRSVLEQLRSGHKTTHWMWFIFPQLAGLGRSEMARWYAIASLDEARAYLADPTLALRLRQAAEAILVVPNRSANDILGEIDATKLRSSMTLFHRADPGETLFGAVLDRFYAGREDPATLELLGLAEDRPS